MDKVDVSILRELTQAQTVLPARPGVMPSYREIARKLDVSPGTVRNRMKMMYKEGVVSGSSVYPNPNLLGLKTGSYTMDVSPLLEKSEVVRMLKAIEGVVFVQNFHGTMVGIAFVYESDVSLDERLATFKETAASKEGVFSLIRYPPCPQDLTAPEAELILRLVRGPFPSYNELASQLGISVRTLERRLSKLVGENAILSVPTMDYRKIAGSIPADLIVFFGGYKAREKAEPEILELLRGSILYAGLWEEFGMYSLIVPRVSEVSDLVAKVNKMVGITMVKGEIVDEHIDNVEVLEGYLERWMEKKGFRLTSAQA